MKNRTAAVIGATLITSFLIVLLLWTMINVDVAKTIAGALVAVGLVSLVWITFYLILSSGPQATWSQPDDSSDDAHSHKGDNK